VVIAILGVLSSVAIPNIIHLMNSGQNEAAATELYNVQVAVTAYMADSENNPTHAVPDSIDDLENYIIGGVAALSYNGGDSGFGAYQIADDGAVTRGEVAEEEV
jgi:type IV pilus assembly protein PilA